MFQIKRFTFRIPHNCSLFLLSICALNSLNVQCVGASNGQGMIPVDSENAAKHLVEAQSYYSRRDFQKSCDLSWRALYSDPFSNEAAALYLKSRLLIVKSFPENQRTYLRLRESEFGMQKLSSVCKRKARKLQLSWWSTAGINTDAINKSDLREAIACLCESHATWVWDHISPESHNGWHKDPSLSEIFADGAMFCSAKQDNRGAIVFSTLASVATESGKRIFSSDDYRDSEYWAKYVSCYVLFFSEEWEKLYDAQLDFYLYVSNNGRSGLFKGAYRPRNILIMMLHQSTEYEKGLKLCQFLVQHPEYTKRESIRKDALCCQSILLDIIGKYNESTDSFHQFCKEFPTYDSYLFLTQFYIGKGLFEDALREINVAIELGMDDAGKMSAAFRLRGDIYESLGDLRRAEASYSMALKHAKDDIETVKALTRVRRQLELGGGSSDDLLKKLEHAIQQR